MGEIERFFIKIEECGRASIFDEISRAIFHWVRKGHKKSPKDTRSGLFGDYGLWYGDDGRMSGTIEENQVKLIASR